MSKLVILTVCQSGQNLNFPVPFLGANWGFLRNPELTLVFLSPGQISDLEEPLDYRLYPLWEVESTDLSVCSSSVDSELWTLTALILESLDFSLNQRKNGTRQNDLKSLPCVMYILGISSELSSP